MYFSLIINAFTRLWEANSKSFWGTYNGQHPEAQFLISEFYDEQSNPWAQFHNNLIQLKFNPKYHRQNNIYFREIYKEC